MAKKKIAAKNTELDAKEFFAAISVLPETPPARVLQGVPGVTDSGSVPHMEV